MEIGRGAGERRRNRFGSIMGASSGGAIAIALLMVLAPAGLAGRTNSSMSAPFGHTSATSGVSSSAVCGSAGGSAAKWKATTGALTGASKASIKSCPYDDQFAFSDNSNWVFVYVPFSVKSTSPYNVSMAYSWKIDSSMAVSPGTCPAAVNYSSGYDDIFCEWGVEWYIDVSTSLVDLTNGSWVSTTYNYWQIQNWASAEDHDDCDYGTCVAYGGSYSGGASSSSYQMPGYDSYDAYVLAGTASGTASLWTNSTSWSAASHSGTNISLNPHDSYAVVAQLWFSTYAYEEGIMNIDTGTAYEYFDFNPAGSAAVSVSAQPSLGLTVSSITVTPVI